MLPLYLSGACGRACAPRVSGREGERKTLPPTTKIPQAVQGPTPHAGSNSAVAPAVASVVFNVHTQVRGEAEREGAGQDGSLGNECVGQARRG